MPYARTNYTLQEIKLGFRKLDTNVTQGNDPATGVPNTQPKPHADIHGADELHSHPLFAKARVTAGDGPGTHSVMDETVMQTELVASSMMRTCNNFWRMSTPEMTPAST